MIGGENPQAHHGAYHRNILVLHKGPHRLSGTCAQMDAAAHADNGPFGSLELFDHFFDLDGVTNDSGLIGADADRLRIDEFADLRVLHIDRDINEDRSAAAGAGNVKGLLHDPRDIRSLAHDIAEFYKRFAGTGDIHLLEDVAPHETAVDLSGDADQRNAVGKGRGNAGDQIGRTGTAGGDSDADFSRDPCIAAGFMGCVLLLPHQDGLNIGIQDTVKERSDGHARIAEDVFHALQLKTFHDCICRYHLYSSEICVI